MTELYIITGASKGIGHALATQLEDEGHAVLRIARTNPNQLDNLLTLDITDKNTPNAIINWITVRLPNASSITLINNAGTIEPIGKIGMLDARQIEDALLLNINAPIILTNAFIHALKTVDLPKFVMNISSGAGQKPYLGWAIYCASKAALDHFTNVLALEQQSAQFPVIVTSIAPGIIDTDMQKTIRSASLEAFPMIEHFKNYKDEGTLSTPEETATQLIRFLRSGKMDNTHPISDVRD